MTVEATWIDSGVAQEGEIYINGGVVRRGEMYTDCEDLRAGIRSGKVAAGDEIVYKGLICAVIDASEESPALMVLRAVETFVNVINTNGV